MAGTPVYAADHFSAEAEETDPFITVALEAHPVGTQHLA